MGNESSEYVPLAQGAADDVDTPTFDRRSKQTSSTLTRILGLICTALLLVVVLLVSVIYATIPHTPPCGSTMIREDGAFWERSLLYSPANEMIEHEVKAFTDGKAHKTKYQGLTPEVDQAWQDLYDDTIMRIPKSQAAMLPNRTYPIEGDPDGYYIALLDVFHQLHCLNAVRMALDKDHYQGELESLMMDNNHIYHCIDSIRQSLMCNADVSVNVWQWNPDTNSVFGRSTQAHSCRNFNKIKNWAAERHLPTFIDLKVHLEDDLEWPNGNY